MITNGGRSYDVFVMLFLSLIKVNARRRNKEATPEEEPDRDITKECESHIPSQTDDAQYTTNIFSNDASDGLRTVEVLT